MKKSNKIKFFLLICALTFFVVYSFIKETYSTIDSATNEFIVSNINKLNSILEEKKDTTNPYFLNEITDDNGNVPAYEYYSDIQSRSIKELRAYNGKIFMGIGDWTNNTGPVKIIYYDTTDEKIKSSGTIPDEAVESYAIIDNGLYTTGADPKGAWGYGSYYVYNEENNNWVQHEFNNGWIHVFDIEKVNNKIFMCGSVTKESEKSPIQVSLDNGKTFQDVIAVKDGEQLPYDDNLRFYGLEKFNGTVYAYTYSSVGNNSYNGIYEYNDESNQFKFVLKLGYAISEYGLAESIRYNHLHFKNNTVFNNKFIYVSGNLMYKTQDMKKFKAIKSPNTDVVQDVVAHDDTLYTLSYQYNEDKTFTTRIYSTKDLTALDLVYEFTIDSFPFSIEYYDNNIYIGTNYHEQSKDYEDYSNGLKTNSESGSLYQIDLNKFKKYLTLDEENKTINITINGMNYPVTYDTTSGNYIFKNILTFNDNMTEKEYQQEFYKLEYMNLLYTLVCNNEYINYDSSVSYYNNILNNNINSSSNALTAIEFAKEKFSTGLNIQDERFNITINNINETEDDYTVEIILEVKNKEGKISSDKYVVNEEERYIYIGMDNDINIIENNLTVEENINLSIDLENNKLLVKYKEDIVSDYTLVRFNTNRKNLNKYIYTANSNDEEILSDINEINCNKKIVDNKLQILVNDNVIDEYLLVRISINKLMVINNNKIYVSNKKIEEIKNNISVINGDIIISDNVLKIVNNNIVLNEMEILSVDFDTFKVNNNVITIPETIQYNEFVSNITTSIGVTYKIFNIEEEITIGNIEEGMILKIYYNDEELDKFDIINEYLLFDKSINVDENNKYLSNINIHTEVNDILSKIDTSGTITIKNNKDELIHDNNLIGTASKIEIQLSNKNYEYLFIVNGDIDGDGKLTLPDIIKMSMYLYDSSDSLNGVYKKAVDYDYNELYNLQDIMKASYRLYKGGE